MSSYDQVVNRWVSIALGTSNTDRQLRNPRMPVEGDRIFSYGSHFEMARVLRDRKRQPIAWLLNGDTWGTTTSGHQSHVRGAVQRTDLPVVIIPHRALNAAGVDRDTVRILEVTSDKWLEREYVEYERPHGSVIEWVPVTDHDAELSWQEYRCALQAQIDKYNADQVKTWEANQQRVRVEQANGGREYEWEEAWRYTKRYYLEKRPAPVGLLGWAEATRGNYYYSRSAREHIRAYRTTTRVTSHRRVCYTSSFKNAEWAMEYLPDGRTRYTRSTRRHLLGESLISGEVGYQVTKRCKWCRATGRAEGPTQAEWIAPKPVTQWMPRGATNPATGLPIPRYGQFDTGMIEPGRWREQPWSRPSCTACRGRGRWTESRTRRAKFLSGFDANESTPSYFFCELPPKCQATTVAEAYDALKPDTVKLAEQMGRQVERQGDIFAIPLASATKAQLRKAGARFERRGQLFGTNHVATDVAYMPNGTTIVRGILHHTPAGRRPDHKRVKLADGKQWYVVQKNTVPLAA